MEKLHNWIFTYNSTSNLWCAATRDNYFLLFNDIANEKVLKSKEINTLIELIVKEKWSQ